MKKFALGIEIGGIVKETFKTAIGNVKRQLKEIRQVSEKVDIGASVKYQKDKLKSQLSDWKSIVGTAISMGTPVVIGASFEYQMKRVKALANANNVEFEKLVSKARELGATTQYSASEVGKAMEYLSMAGFKVGQTLKATRGILNLATVGNIDLGTSADIASNILSGFGMKADEINRVVDVMAKTITSSNTSVSELGETMKYVAPIASKVGASIEEVSAMTGLLANIGIKGSSAGTALRAMFLRLSAPTGEARMALARLGVQVKNAQGKIRPMTDILADLHKRLSLLPESMRMQYLKSIFGEEPASAISELIKQAGTGNLQKYIQDIKNAKGSAEKMVAEMNDTVLAKWKSVLSALEGIFLTIYKPLEPIIKFTLDTVVAGLRTLNKVLEFTAPVLSPVVFGLGSLFLVSKVVSIGMTIANLGVLQFVGGLIKANLRVLSFSSSLVKLASKSILASNSLKLSSLSLSGFSNKVKASVVSMVSVVRKSFFSVISASRIMAGALLTNPIFWIGAAIAGVGYLVIRNWDKVRYFFKGVWKGLKEDFKPVIATFETVSNVVSSILEKVKSTIGSIFGDGTRLMSIGEVVGKTIGFAFSPVVAGFKIVNWIFSKIVSLDFSNVGSAISQSFKVAFAPIGLVFNSIDWLSKKISSLDFSKVSNSLKSAFLTPFVFFGNAIGKVEGLFSGLGNTIKKSLEFAFNKIVSFDFSKVGNAIKNVFLSPVKFIENVIGKFKEVFNVLKGSFIGKVLSFGENVVGGVVSKASGFFKSVFHRENKEKKIEKATEKIKTERLERVSVNKGSTLKVDSFIGSFVLNVNVSSKEIVKEIQKQAPEIKAVIERMINDVLAEKERKLRLSYGR